VKPDLALPEQLQDLPARLGELPGALGELPGRIAELPGALGHLPARLGELPGGIAELPGALGEVPARLPAATARLGTGGVERARRARRLAVPLLVAGIVAGAVLVGRALRRRAPRDPMEPDSAPA